MATSATNSIRIGLDLVSSVSGVETIGLLGGALMGLSNLVNGFSTLGLDSTLLAWGAAAAAAGLETLAFDDALKTLIQDGGQLEYSMAMVNIAVAGTPAQIQALDQAMVTWADSSLYSVSQVDQGIRAMGEEGFNAQQILDGIGQQAIYLGEAIGTDVVPAASLLGAVLNIFSSQGLTATQAANGLTAAFYNGIPSASALQSAYQMAGGEAVATGVTFKDLTVALDLLAQAGFTGQEAGTALRYLMQTLADPTLKATKELSQLGIVTINTTNPALRELEARLAASGKAGKTAVTDFNDSVTGLDALFKAAQKANLIPLDETFTSWAMSTGIMSSKLYDAQGNFVGIGQAVLDLISVLGNTDMTAQQKIDALGNIFNVRSGRAAAVLVNLKDFKDHYNRVQKQFESSSALKDANDLLNTLPGRWKEFTTTLSSFWSTAGLPVADALKGILAGVNGLVSGLMKNQPQIMTFFGYFIVAGAILAPVVLAIASIALGIGAIALIAPEALPFIVVFVGVLAGIPLLAAGVAGGLLWVQGELKKIQPYLDQFNTIWQQDINPALKTFWTVVGQQVLPVLKQLWPEIKVGIMALGAMALIIVGVVVGAFLAWSFVIGGVLILIAKVVQFIQWLDGEQRKVAQSIVQHWNQIGPAISGIFNGHLTQDAYNWGWNMIEMMAKGIRDAANINLLSALLYVAKMVYHYLGHNSPPPGGPLADDDQYMPRMMRMFADGIESHTPLLANAARNAANTTRFALTQGMLPNGLLLGGAPSSTGTGAAGNQTVVVQVGNQQLFTLMMNALTGQMQLNGLGRAFH